MMKLMRKHRDWLMIVIAVLALPFVFYFVQKPDYGRMRSGQFARVFGRSISEVEVQREARLFGLARALGMAEFLRDLTLSATKEEDMIQEFVLNLAIVRHEAEQLGIQPGRAQVVELIRNLPAFRGVNGYDPKKYEEFSGNLLGPNGFTETQIEELAIDELCLKKIKDLLALGVSLPEAEIKIEFEQAYGKNFASVVRFNLADFAKEVKISDDDVRKYFDAHKDEFKTDEKRKTELVRFALGDEQKKLTGKERVDTLMKLQDRANDFAQGLLEKDADFDQVAKKLQVPVETTGEFSLQSPDPKLKDKTKLSAIAFQLTSREPTSDVIEEEDGYYIARLAGVTPARPLSLDEAKPKILEALKMQRERELLANKGAQVAHDLREAAKSNQPLPQVCQKDGVKLEKVEPFAIADDAEVADNKPKTDSPDLTSIKNAVVQIQPGEVSDFLPDQNGGVIVVLEKREPPDPVKDQKTKAAVEERYLKNKREIVFFEWLRDRQQASGLQMAQG